MLSDGSVVAKPLSNSNAAIHLEQRTDFTPTCDNQSQTATGRHVHHKALITPLSVIPADAGTHGRGTLAT